MNSFTKLSAQDRSDVIRDAADTMGLAPTIIEKDFWVCWILKHVFEEDSLGPHLIFKGGTTLSKVYRVISRFSEDVDISISRSLLGFDGKRDPANPALSNKQRKSIFDDMSEQCGRYVCTDLKAKIGEFAAEALREEDSWSVEVDQNDEAKQTLLFKYPSFEANLDYITPHVRIECGCRSDSWPVESENITPYAAEYVPQAFIDADCPVTALSVGRTFWEKATILHQESHRPEDKALPPRYSRHYYDLAMLANSPHRAASIEDLDLLAHVVEHKKLYFRCGWAEYDLAAPGTLRLTPQASRVSGLKNDYEQMSSMFFGERPSFEDVLATLSTLEDEINGSHV